MQWMEKVLLKKEIFMSPRLRDEERRFSFESSGIKNA
jgi:hypothetical protein